MRLRGWLAIALGLLTATLMAQATLPKELQQRYARALQLAAQGKLREAEPLLREVVQKQPNFAPARLNLGLVYRMLEQNDKALPHLRRAAELNPKDPRPLVELARLCLDTGKLGDARGYLRMLRDRFPNEPELPVLEGALAVLQGEWGAAYQQLQQAVQRRPNDFRLHYNLGIAAYQLKRYDEAEKHLKRAVELKPDYITGWKSLGMAYEARNLPEHAIRAYTEALKREPDDLPTRLKRALLYQSVQNLNAALADFQHLTKVYPRNPEAHIGAGLILMRQERYREALAHLGAAQSLLAPSDPLALQILTEMGHCNLQLKQYGKAREQFAQVLKLMPKNARAYEGQWQALQAQEMETELLPFLRNWQANLPDDPRPTLYIARVYERNRLTTEADKEYKQLLQKFPNQTEFIREYAQFLSRHGREDEATQLYDQLLQQLPNETAVLLAKARLAEKRGEHAQALELYQRVLQHEPSNEVALLGAAAMHKRLGQSDAANAIYRKMTLEMEPPNPIAFSNLTEFYRQQGRAEELLAFLKQMAQRHGDRFLPILASEMLQAGKGEEAIALFQDALQREPNNPQLHRLLGVVYESLQRTEDALRAYQRAHELAPSDTWTLYHIAQIQAQQGRKEAAYDTLTRALRLNPDDLSLYPMLERLSTELERTAQYRALLQELAQRDTPGQEALKAYVNLLQREGKLDNALALVQRRLRDKPDDATLLNLQLGLLHTLGRHREMLSVYARLARLNPQDISLLRNWAMHAEQYGSTVEVVIALQALYQAAPDDISAGLKLARYLELAGQRYRAQELLRIMRDNFPMNADIRKELERLEGAR
ncbi:MAG: tetratricopeptide repeat protein [Fimbriimonadales bacterium]|nr:tetratricopeptide repeat protein [Fimbriimonadales bacterium]